MKDKDLLQEARERFKLALDADRQNREEALEDIRFVAGEQWHEQDKLSRETDGRPCLTVNLLPKFIRQVTGEARQNTPAIRVRPVDSGADVITAEIYSGIIRHIEAVSQAKVSYITALDNTCRGGQGAWRIVTQYADEGGFEQEIRIKRIKNPMAVLFDPDAEEITKHDAMWCFVFADFTVEGFKEKYPGASTVGFEKDSHPQEYLRDWWDGKSIRVAEYWKRVPIEKEIGLLADGLVIELDGIPREQRAKLKIVQTRKVKSFKACCYKMNGVEMLEDKQEFPSQYLPIIPVVGEEINLGTHTIRRSMIRDAKDSMRLYNYWQTTAAETIALAPKAPYLLTKDQVKGHEKMWREANNSMRPYLLYNASKDAVMPQRAQGPQTPGALLEMLQLAQNDLNGTIGLYQPSLGEQGNEKSGRAILARERQGDTGTFVFLDNLALAIEHTGRVIVDMIPRVMDTRRMVRILGEDGAQKLAEINVPQIGKGTLMNDVTVGKYDVYVDSGPSYATKRMETAASILDFIKVFPQAAPVLGDILAKNMDWAGVEEISKRLSLLLPPQLQPGAQQQPRLTPALVKEITEQALASVEAQKGQAETRKITADAVGQELENAKMQAWLRTAVAAAARGEPMPPMPGNETPAAPKPGAGNKDPRRPQK